MYKNQIKRFEVGWNKGETVCGSGSLLISCQEMIKLINETIKKYDIKIINDVGCGDLNYIKHTKEYNIKYYPRMLTIYRK